MANSLLSFCCGKPVSVILNAAKDLEATEILRFAQNDGNRFETIPVRTRTSGPDQPR
jgi:hypothetical protein